MSNNVGPVCHIPPTNTPANPHANNVPGLAAAPTDLPSALAAIRNLQQIIKALTGQNVNNNTFNTFTIKSKPDKTQWAQSDIQYETVRVYQNNDKTSQNWVDVQRINSLTMKDKATGNLWSWKRQSNGTS